MKKYMLFTVLFGICSMVALPMGAAAMPGMGGKDQSVSSEKYTKMDSNKDDVIDAEEFKAAYPTMKEGVFDLIDTNTDKAISREEWMDFQVQHMQGMDKAPAKKQGGSMLINPPSSSK